MADEMKFDFFKVLESIHLKNLANIKLPIDNENRFFYLDTYKALKAFISKALEELPIEKDLCIALAHMVYGWMPTILNETNDKIRAWTKNNWSEIKRSLEKAKSGKNLSKNELNNVMVLTNNSIVGTSKLLHFINSNVYPIYDSRVFHAIRKLAGDKKKTEDSSTVNDENKYIAYVEWIHRIINDDVRSLVKIKKQLKESGFIDNDVSNVRVIEVLLYIYGKQE